MNTIKLMGKIYANILICAIIGSIMILIESVINTGNILEASISIGISILSLFAHFFREKIFMRLAL